MFKLSSFARPRPTVLARPRARVLVRPMTQAARVARQRQQQADRLCLVYLATMLFLASFVVLAGCAANNYQPIPEHDKKALAKLIERL